MSAFAVDLVMRFCGGPLDSGGPCLPSTVRLLVAQWLLLVVACPIFVFVARCNVGFVLAALTLTLQIMIKYTNNSCHLRVGPLLLLLLFWAINLETPQPKRNF
jgi:hypothetical protein